MQIPVKTSQGGYDIILERGALKNAGEYLALERRCLIVTDDGVPVQYSKAVADCCKHPTVVTLPHGESSKCFENYRLLLETMIKDGFTRTDCVIAVGGGVMGDLAGFAAASYMRGIDFYNIPTTLLSQVDSSIGGKVAIDLDGYKNIVGAFYPPKRVLIDPDTLSTLDKRQLANGMSEAIKMAACFDAELFELIESGSADIDTVIHRSLLIKRDVVEKDEHETGLRRVLNFGHTVGHAIERENPQLLHGECVAIGMLQMCSDAVKPRLEAVLKNWLLPTEYATDKATLTADIRRDKKASGERVTLVFVSTLGEFEFRTVDIEEVL